MPRWDKQVLDHRHLPPESGMLEGARHPELLDLVGAHL